MNKYDEGRVAGLKAAADAIAREYDRAACGAGKAALLFAAADVKKQIDAIVEVNAGVFG